MGSSQSKIDENIVNTNLAVGVDKSSHMTVIAGHVSTTNCILIAIITILGIGALYVLYKNYRKCHAKLVHREVNEFALRRYASLLRRQPRPHSGVFGGKPEEIV